MGYPPRDEMPGCDYHIGTKGNNGRLIFTSPDSYALFLIHLKTVVARYEWTVVAYCLMPNHYHFLIRIGDRGFSNGMKDLNGGYAIAYNIRNDRRDHLFGRRFWSRRINDDNDLLETARYIELNPARAERPLNPALFRWSSYRAAVGIVRPLPFHQPSILWEILDPQPRRGMAAYAEFLEEPFLDNAGGDASGVRHRV